MIRDYIEEILEPLVWPAIIAAGSAVLGWLADASAEDYILATAVGAFMMFLYDTGA